MTTATPYNLRSRLRSGSSSAHQELDRLVSRFDLGTAPGLSAFVSMQYAALTELMRLKSGDLTAGAIIDLRQRADTDLGSLGAPRPAPLRRLTAPLAPIAVDYVIAGSRLGTKVLRKRWLASSAPRVQGARAYFSAPDYIECWQRFCHDALEIDPSEDAAVRILEDVNRMFALYTAAALAALDQYGTVDA